MREARAASTRVTRPESTRRLTVVAPHPDDEVFGIGGLMRELVLRGHRLRVLAVTDGEAAFGHRDLAAGRALAELRAEERTAAFEALGIAGHTEVIRAAVPRRCRRRPRSRAGSRHHRPRRAGVAGDVAT